MRGAASGGREGRTGHYSELEVTHPHSSIYRHVRSRAIKPIGGARLYRDCPTAIRLGELFCHVQSVFQSCEMVRADREARATDQSTPPDQR